VVALADEARESIVVVDQERVDFLHSRQRTSDEGFLDPHRMLVRQREEPS